MTVSILNPAAAECPGVPPSCRRTPSATKRLAGPPTAARAARWRPPAGTHARAPMSATAVESVGFIE